MGDQETGTRWNHLTGEAVYGPLAGKILPTEVVIHTTVEQALATDPDALVAISNHPRARAQTAAGGSAGLSGLLDRIRGVPPMFPATLGTEDNRRPRMDIGIGIWDTERRARYYSMSTVDGAGGAVLDTLAGRTVVVYFDPSAHSLQALYMDAGGARWEGDVLVFDSGARIEDGVLQAEEGTPLEMDRPLQVFTRWYGFSLTFPDTEVYEAR